MEFHQSLIVFEMVFHMFMVERIQMGLLVLHGAIVFGDGMHLSIMMQLIHSSLHIT